MKNWSLRRKLTFWSASFTGCALLVFGWAIAYFLYQEDIEALDELMDSQAHMVFHEWDEHPEKPKEHCRELQQLPQSGTAICGFVVGDKNEKPRVVRPDDLASVLKDWPPKRGHFTKSYKGHNLRFRVFEHKGTLLVLAASLESAEEEVISLASACLIAFPLVMLVVAGGSWWIARRALQPITAISQAAASITASHLDQRLPGLHTKDEISEHIQVLNSMFDRLQRSFEQATRFTADASHELRTPLTIMRGQIEDALRTGHCSEEHESLLVGLLEETSVLQKTAENLLLLSCFDAGKSPLHRTVLDLSALVEEAAEDAELLASPKKLQISTHIGPGLRVDGDATMMRRVLLNLIDNAVKYNDEGGRLELSLQSLDGSAVLKVGNSGPGIPPDRHSALFTRFFRSHPDRSRESGGSGLGLSLCQEIVTAHGGRIHLVSSNPGWTEFSIELPEIKPAP